MIPKIGGLGNTRPNPTNSVDIDAKGLEVGQSKLQDYVATRSDSSSIAQQIRNNVLSPVEKLNLELRSQTCGDSSDSILDLKLFVHLDYLRVSCELSPGRFDEFMEYFGSEHISVSMDIPWCAGNGAMWYDNTIKSNIGIQGGFTYDDMKNRYFVMLDLSGQYFSGKSVENQWRMLVGLRNRYSAKCSRIDIAIDDESFSLIPVKEMRQGWENGENFSFKTHKYVESGKTFQDLVKTYYYGSRSSGKMVRVYNHGDECQRFEAEFKRAYAPFAFQCISLIKREWFNGEIGYIDAVKEIEGMGLKSNIVSWLKEALERLHGCNEDFEIVLQKIMGSLAVSAIDFRDRSSRKDRSKASRKDTKRCDYYQKFVELVGSQIRIKLPRVRNNIEKTVIWLQRQVSKSLSIIKDSLNAIEYKEWEDSLISQGRERQTMLDLKLIRHIRNNPRLVSIT